MEKSFLLKQFRILIKSLPKNNRFNNKHLYLNKPSDINNELEAQNREEKLKDLQIYLTSCKQYNVIFLI